MTVDIKWHAPSPQDVCLMKDEIKLNCWYGQQSVATQIEITLTESMIFSLVSNAGETLASQTIEVNASSHQAYRRRLKSDWSLF